MWRSLFVFHGSSTIAIWKTLHFRPLRHLILIPTCFFHFWVYHNCEMSGYCLHCGNSIFVSFVMLLQPSEYWFASNNFIMSKIRRRIRGKWQKEEYQATKLITKRGRDHRYWQNDLIVAMGKTWVLFLPLRSLMPWIQFDVQEFEMRLWSNKMQQVKKMLISTG